MSNKFITLDGLKTYTEKVKEHVYSKIDENNQGIFNSLENKAEVTYVDNELAKKAEQTYVDEELAKKAEIYYVNKNVEVGDDLNGKTLYINYAHFTYDLDMTYLETDTGKKAITSGGPPVLSIDGTEVYNIWADNTIEITELELSADFGVVTSVSVPGMFYTQEVVDCGYNYNINNIQQEQIDNKTDIDYVDSKLTEKADKYVITIDKYDVNFPISIGMDLSGKTIYFNTGITNNNYVDYFTTESEILSSSGGYTLKAFSGPPDLSFCDSLGNETPIWTYYGSTGSGKSEWYMSSLTLPDDFGIVTGCDSAEGVVSLGAWIIDTEYNYNAIQTKADKYLTKQLKTISLSEVKVGEDLRGVTLIFPSTVDNSDFSNFNIGNTVDTTKLIKFENDYLLGAIYYNGKSYGIATEGHIGGVGYMGEYYFYSDSNGFYMSSFTFPDEDGWVVTFVPETYPQVMIDTQFEIFGDIVVDCEYNYQKSSQLSSEVNGLSQDMAVLQASKLEQKDLLTQIYPVGSIYMSVNSTSPASFLGGTWERIRDKFLLSAGSTYSAGSTGGSEAHTHGLSSGYAKIYMGTLAKYSSSTTVYGLAMDTNASTSYWTANRATRGTSSTGSMAMDYSYNDTAVASGTKLAGSTDSANNMPPYQVVYMWKRTA